MLHPSFEVGHDLVLDDLVDLVLAHLRVLGELNFIRLLNFVQEIFGRGLVDVGFLLLHVSFVKRVV